MTKIKLRPGTEAKAYRVYKPVSINARQREVGILTTSGYNDVWNIIPH